MFQKNFVLAVFGNRREIKTIYQTYLFEQSNSDPVLKTETGENKNNFNYEISV